MDQLLEFDRQVDTLIRKGYPAAAGLAENEFLAHIGPLRARLADLVLPSQEMEGRLPFVIVIKRELVAVEKAMSLVERDGKKGIISMYPVKPADFKPIDRVTVPDSLAYLLMDIDRGDETINVTPDDALEEIKKQGRSPVTIEEGIAVVTHYPEFLKKNRCFSLPGSRCGDRRVTAIWISEGRPRLGWCWAGNPHTWLGSASCRTRFGP